MLPQASCEEDEERLEEEEGGPGEEEGGPLEEEALLEVELPPLPSPEEELLISVLELV